MTLYSGFMIFVITCPGHDWTQVRQFLQILSIVSVNCVMSNVRLLYASYIHLRLTHLKHRRHPASQSKIVVFPIRANLGGAVLV